MSRGGEVALTCAQTLAARQSHHSRVIPVHTTTGRERSYVERFAWVRRDRRWFASPQRAGLTLAVTPVAQRYAWRTGRRSAAVLLGHRRTPGLPVFASNCPLPCSGSTRSRQCPTSQEPSLRSHIAVRASVLRRDVSRRMSLAHPASTRASSCSSCARARVGARGDYDRGHPP